MKSIYPKVMIDSNGKSAVYLFLQGESIPFHVLSQLEAEILSKELQQCLEVRSAFTIDDGVRTAFLKSYDFLSK